MNRRYINILTATLLLFVFLGACQNNDEPDPNTDPNTEEETDTIPDESGEYVAPDAPATTTTSNLFSVAFYSTLTDTQLNISAVSSLLEEEINQSDALLMMFDRSDIEIGVADPLLSLSLATQTYYNFAPRGYLGTQIEGTGMIASSNPTERPGKFIQDSIYVQGALVSASLISTVEVTIGTTHITSEKQLEQLVQLYDGEIPTHTVIVGTITKSMVESVPDYLKSNCKYFRYYLSDAGDANDTEAIFVLTHYKYCVREVAQKSIQAFDQFTIQLEYLPTIY